MKKFLNYFSIVLVFISFTSCLNYKDLEVREVESVKILSMGEHTADVEVTLKVFNPNHWRIVVKDYDLQAFINKKHIGDVKFDKKILIPKQSERSYKLIVTTDMDQVKKIMPSLMFSNKAVLNIKGDLKVKAKGISKKFQLDHEEKISRKDLGNIMTASN